MPQNDPPVIPVPTSLASAIASSTWTQIGSTPYGRFYSGTTPQYMSAIGPSPSLACDTTACSGGNIEHVCSSADAPILQTTANANGSITYGGSSYKVQQYWDSTNAAMVAKCVKLSG